MADGDVRYRRVVLRWGGGGGGDVQSNISHIEPEEYASNTIPLEA